MHNISDIKNGSDVILHDGDRSYRTRVKRVNKTGVTIETLGPRNVTLTYGADQPAYAENGLWFEII